MSAKTKKAAKRAPAKKTPRKSAPPKKAAKKTPKPKAVEKPEEEAPKEEVVEEVQEAKPAPVAKPKAAMEKPGAAPLAEVSARHLDSMHHRGGRGFSLGELDSAGVPRSAAKRFDLSVDVRRRSVLNENVEKLRSWFKPQAKAGGEKKS